MNNQRRIYSILKVMLLSVYLTVFIEPSILFAQNTESQKIEQSQEELNEALFVAVTNGRLDKARELISQGADVNVKNNRGLRYSWGYPSCPDISQHKLVWKILDPVQSGMTLTESGQIVPDHSTAAIVVHHPEAQYFIL